MDVLQGPLPPLRVWVIVTVIVAVPVVTAVIANKSVAVVAGDTYMTVGDATSPGLPDDALTPNGANPPAPVPIPVKLTV